MTTIAAALTTPLSPRYVAREVLEALNYLHTLSAPIIHRDVKPSNLLVKSECGCANPLVCVCRLRPLIVSAIVIGHL